MVFVDQLEIVVSFNFHSRFLYNNSLAYVTDLGLTDALRITTMLFLGVCQSGKELFDFRIFAVNYSAKPILFIG